MDEASPEAKALLLARRGDASAYGELVRAHQEAAFRAAYLILHDAQAAEDIAQEGFIRAYNQLHRFREEHAFKPWLLRIVSNLALNESRRRRRGIAVLERFGRQAAFQADGPENASTAAGMGRELRRAIDRLGDEDRQVLYLRYFLDLSESEMAQAIGRPPGTVKSRLHRAGRRLRALIEREYPHLRSGDDGP